MTAKTPAPALLHGYPVTVELPVQWGEMDAYGHVNNAVFFRYFESARIAYLERCGFLESFERNRVGAILHSTDCRFRLPLHYPDTVLVGTRADEVGEDRFTMGYRVVSRSQQAIVADGHGVVVSFNYVTQEKVPIPEFVRDRIAELQRDAQRAASET